MAAFPGAEATFTGFTSSHTLLADSHASQHNLEQGEIIATQHKLGTGASTPTSGVVLRGNGAGASTWGQAVLTTDVTGVLPVLNGGTGVTTVALFLANIYPIGCIYTETTGVNPNTTFGFGTWVAFGAGRVLVGNGSSDQAFAAGATGGESNHALITAELASHTHTVTDPGHTHPIKASNGGLGTTAFQRDADDAFGTISSNSATTGITNQNTGSGTAHNNLQPYIVVYFWQRTA